MSDSTPPHPSERQQEPEEEQALPWYRQPWVHFSAGFAILVSVLEVGYHGYVLDSDVFSDFLKMLARMTGALLEPFYERVNVLHARVATNKFVVTVDEGCDGLQVCTLLTAAVIAFPSTWKQKLVGVVLGNLWLQAWNVTRIATLVVVGGVNRDWFHPTHVYVWPTLLIAICLGTWLTWANWILGDDDPHERTEAPA